MFFIVFFPPQRVIKGLGESDSEDESATAWVQKSRQVQKEKEMAEKRVC